MTRIFLIRHGETQWNFDARYQGHSDIELSEKGTLQGEKLGLYFKRFSLDAVYASDLKRAFTTAQLIAQYHNLEVQLVPDMREINFGVWEGLTFKDIREKYRELADMWLKEPEQLVIPEGENFAQVKKRAYQAILNLVDKHQGQNVVVVSHGGTIRTVLCAILDLPLSKMWQIKQDNTALNMIEFYQNQGIIGLLNSTAHLD